MHEGNLKIGDRIKVGGQRYQQTEGPSETAWRKFQEEVMFDTAPPARPMPPCNRTSRRTTGTVVSVIPPYVIIETSRGSREMGLIAEAEVDR